MTDVVFLGANPALPVLCCCEELFPRLLAPEVIILLAAVLCSVLRTGSEDKDLIAELAVRKFTVLPVVIMSVCPVNISEPSTKRS